jgi:hypothetical protein
MSHITIHHAYICSFSEPYKQFLFCTQGLASSELNVELPKYLFIMQLPKVDSLKIDQKVAETSPFWKTSFFDLEKWMKSTFSPLRRQLLSAHAQWNLKQTEHVK